MAETWTSKDPHATLDYVYRIPLDEGDTVSASTFAKLSGDVVIDSQNRVAQEWTVFLSGGTEGETNVFRVSWETAGGREDDDIVTLAIIANEVDIPLVLTGYDKPGPAHLALRYPAFEDIEPTTVQYWLTDAERYVDTSWLAGDYAAGLMALAAHNMTLAGLGATATQLASIPLGLSSLKSADLSLNFTQEAANSRVAGDLKSTRYGMEFIALRRRNKGGARVTSTGALPYDPRVFPMGEW